MNNSNTIIFFLPYAGGSSLTYLSWQKYLENYEVYALDYRGHGLRMKEKLCSSIIEMAEDISVKINDIILKKNKKFVLFGHSLGGLIAWHVTNILEEKYGILPEKLYVSACSSPLEFHKNIHFRIIGTTEEEQNEFLIKEFLENGNIDKSILESKYFREKLLPIIKHDYVLINDYHFNGKIKKIDTPIYTFYAKDDKLVPEKSILKWQDLTLNNFKMFKFLGNHYYLENEENKKEICKILNNFDRLQFSNSL